MSATITDRIDAITEIPASYLCDDPPCPKSVKIELTARCNFACSFCATANKLRGKGDMDRAFYRRLIAGLRVAGVEEVGLFYLGESFLVPWLPEAIAEAKAEGFPYVFLTTNGSLAWPDRVKLCMEAGLDSLKFSLNYADEAQFSEIARVKPKMYGDMIENIKSARKIRDEGKHACGLFGSYIKYDGEQGVRMAEALETIAPYLDEVYALPLYSQADLVGTALNGMDVRAGNPGRADAMREPIPCWSLFTEARVSFDGHLSACCFDHDGRFHMGDLNKLPFMEAWHSPAFRTLRNAHLAHDVSETACVACTAYS